MKYLNWLNKPPTKPLIGAHSKHPIFRRDDEWSEALKKSGNDWMHDHTYRGLKSFIPSGHVKFDPPYAEFYYSEEFINAIFYDPQFFLAWNKINNL